MQINANITGIEYRIFLSSELKKYSFDNFDINKSPASFLLESDKFSYAVSKWVSPKRTRSYPFERVYNTLAFSKKITIIPVVKDEGLAGDRDFLQWDTISLMSLLDVYVIIASYDSAEKHKSKDNKITNQKLNNEYIKSKICEIKDYHSSALHWNLKEMQIELSKIIDISTQYFEKIEVNLGVMMHNKNGLKLYKDKVLGEAKDFIEYSRNKARSAQNCEFLAVQPKEYLQTRKKAKFVIKNYLGGEYYLTVDEAILTGNNLYIIESKHSKNSKLPSISDIKDGLIKMVLYSNLRDICVEGKEYICKPILKLTSEKMNGKFELFDNSSNVKEYSAINNFNIKQQNMIEQLICEAQNNKFNIVLSGREND